MLGLMSYRRFGRAQSLHSNRAEQTLGRYEATELWLELGRYVATKRNGRSVRARSLHSNRVEQTLGRYIATERNTHSVVA
ncbi:hypothetical protein DY000_02060810 [Brassica cretica]|uniref:Uncharacterized protein n=1 Tax=Brassica cretica TaxID=69181 RepID=A0ABQ7APT1_BRACR|nr:hypothetical protein DY000_02060810 [Brassica cretica]